MSLTSDPTAMLAIAGGVVSLVAVLLGLVMKQVNAQVAAVKELLPATAAGALAAGHASPAPDQVSVRVLVRQDELEASHLRLASALERETTGRERLAEQVGKMAVAFGEVKTDVRWIRRALDQHSEAPEAPEAPES